MSYLLEKCRVVHLRRCLRLDTSPKPSDKARGNAKGAVHLVRSSLHWDEVTASVAHPAGQWPETKAGLAAATECLLPVLTEKDAVTEEEQLQQLKNLVAPMKNAKAAEE